MGGAYSIAQELRRQHSAPAGASAPSAVERAVFLDLLGHYMVHACVCACACVCVRACVCVYVCMSACMHV